MYKGWQKNKPNQSLIRLLSLITALFAWGLTENGWSQDKERTGDCSLLKPVLTSEGFLMQVKGGLHHFRLGSRPGRGRTLKLDLKSVEQSARIGGLYQIKKYKNSACNSVKLAKNQELFKVFGFTTPNYNKRGRMIHWSDICHKVPTATKDLYSKQGDLKGKVQCWLGTLHGTMLINEPDGTWEVQFKKGKVHGSVSRFDKLGSLSESFDFENGLISGKGSWYRNNILEREVQYKQGKVEGSWREFDSDGELTKHLEIKSGKPHGKFFSRKRTKKNDWQETSGTYKNGKQHGVWTQSVIQIVKSDRELPLYKRLKLSLKNSLSDSGGSQNQEKVIQKITGYRYHFDLGQQKAKKKFSKLEFLDKACSRQSHPGC